MPPWDAHAYDGVYDQGLVESDLAESDLAKTCRDISKLEKNMETDTAALRRLQTVAEGREEKRREHCTMVKM